MKYLVIGALALGIYTGAISIPSIDIKMSDIATQECDEKLNGRVVFLKSFNVDHPLGKNTCGDMHAIYPDENGKSLIGS